MKSMSYQYYKSDNNHKWKNMKNRIWGILQSHSEHATDNSTEEIKIVNTITIDQMIRFAFLIS